MNRVDTLLLTLSLLLTEGSVVWSQTKAPKTTVPTGGEIHGSVIAEVGDKTVRFCNFPVALNEKGSPGSVDETRTDVLGRYYFERQRSGEYEVTPLQSGWKLSGQAVEFKLGRGTKHIKPIIVKPDDEVAVVGEIALEDGGAVFREEPTAGFRQTVEVGLGTGRDGSRRVSCVNAYGEFVAAGLPPGPLTVDARLVQTHNDGQKEVKFVSDWFNLKSTDTKWKSQGGVVSLETLSLPSGASTKTPTPSGK